MSADADAAGLAARRLALQVLTAVVRKHQPLDEALLACGQDPAAVALSGADRAFTRALITAALRHLGHLKLLLGQRLRLGVPENSGAFEPVMWLAMTQLLYLDVPDHAAVDTAISLIRGDRRAERYAGLANATLRRLAGGRAAFAPPDPALNPPEWLLERWSAVYGADTARAIAAAQMLEPTLDITVKDDAAAWAERLEGVLVGECTVRVLAHTPVPDLPGYAEGAWWVQDAAASLPAMLIAPRPGLHVLDLCAAPGGKTAQLLAAGATVTALDRSEPRLARLRENLARLHLAAETVIADAATFEHAPFDAVLLDAPCSATGTIRRHPDVAWSKTGEDIIKLAALQRRLLDRAATLVRPGGTLVYATCSLEPEEGERQVEAFLARHAAFHRRPAESREIPGFAECLLANGDIRALPSQHAHPQPRLAGWDGFYAARMIRVDEAR